jgi:predicted GNAT superfamily acetyltransferase
MAVSPALEVRDVRGPEELRACQALQRRTWGITEEGYVLPVATMAGAQKVGGLVLGAFQGQRLVGFSFAFLGRLRGELVLYSQLTAVDPQLQGGGIGRLLKFEQRRRAQAMGVASVVWAFDPLQASNAHFNLVVLGATSRTYEIDLYGSRTDPLNVGLATDRLLAEWSTHSESHPLWEPVPGCITVEIPANVAQLKAMSPEQAMRYQLNVREELTRAFEHGYVAVGFSRADPEHPCYLLQRPA